METILFERTLVQVWLAAAAAMIEAARRLAAANAADGSGLFSARLVGGAACAVLLVQAVLVIRFYVSRARLVRLSRRVMQNTEQRLDESLRECATRPWLEQGALARPLPLAVLTRRPIRHPLRLRSAPCRPYPLHCPTAACSKRARSGSSGAAGSCRQRQTKLSAATRRQGT